MLILANERARDCLLSNSWYFFLKRLIFRAKLTVRGATWQNISNTTAHLDSRRMYPTTQLNTSNSHTQGTPKSRRCSWSNPLPRECSGSELLEVVFWSWLFVGNHWITEWHPHPNMSPQPRPNPLVSCIATRWSYPTHVQVCWLRRWTSAVTAPRTTSPTVRLRTGHPVFLFLNAGCKWVERSVSCEEHTRSLHDLILADQHPKKKKILDKKDTTRIPPVENGPFRLDFFSTGISWSFFLSSVDSVLLFWCSS